jgi:predicted transposase YdaD
VTKPYDQAFKLLTEEDPRATLALFAGIPLSVAMDVRVLDREVNLSALQVDNLYRCRTADAEFLVHIEAVTRFRTAALDRQFDYVQAIVAKYRMACRSYLVLLTEKGVPASLPRVLRRAYGDFEATLRLRAVRLWRIPAARILRLESAQLLPWVPLLRASTEEMEEAMRRLDVADENALRTRLFLLGGLRYGSREAFLERLDQMIISEEILKESSTYQYLIEKGRAAGLAEGFVDGRREALVKLLTRRFGPLPADTRRKLNAATIEKLDRWLDNVLDAPTLKDALK